MLLLNSASQHYCSILDLSNSNTLHAEHAVETEARAVGLNLPLPQIILSETHPTSVRPHQFRELGIT